MVALEHMLLLVGVRPGLPQEICTLLGLKLGTPRWYDLKGGGVPIARVYL